MEDEPEICRVCRCEGTPNQPLFYPCKCSGSIRYVHQDCLTEWLSHSKKKYCELCNHPYTFTSVYRSDMPKVLPVRLFVGQMRKKIAFVLRTAARAAFVSIVWLVMLPYVTVWMWRLLLWFVEVYAVNLGKLQGFSETISKIYNEGSLPTWRKHSWEETLNPRTMISDCFEGQIVTCIVVIAFVGVFLLREWIVQNIPADFDANEDAPAELPQLVDAHLRQLNQERLEEFRQILRANALNEEQLRARDNTNRQQENRGSTPSYAWTSDMETNGSTTAGSDPDYSPESDDQDDDTSDNHRSPGPTYESRSHSTIIADSQRTDMHTRFTHAESSHSIHREAVESSSHRYPLRTRNIGTMDNHQNSFQMAEDATELDDHDDTEFIEADHPDDDASDDQSSGEEEAQFEDGTDDEDDDDGNEDEDDEALGDEIDGVLEAIGMRGSFSMLFQNVSLMFFLISCCLSVAVWIPYMFGVTFLLVTPLDIVRFPFYIASLLGDPLVDFLLLITSRFVWPAIKSASRWSEHFIQKWSLDAYVPSVIREHLSHISWNVFTGAKMGSLPKPLSMSVSSEPATILDTMWQNVTHRWIEWKELYKPSLETAMLKYQSVAFGHTALDRSICILVGYVIVIMVGSLYLSRARQAYARIGRTAQEVIRQHGIMMKVGMFIAIELSLFPIGCGILLDISTLPLFNNATLEGRLDFTKNYPLSSLFLHWFIGTGFMFMFAIVVTVFRQIVRPGVIWFIRDPNDPQFHPIKEIVERPVFTQLRKIGASGILYGMVIMVGVGGVVRVIHNMTTDLLPLRLNISQPFSVVPFDLLLVHVAIPAMVKYFQPKKAVKDMIVQWITLLASGLRLTSFLFGGRHVEEEGNVHYKTWLAWLRRDNPEYPADEQQRVTVSNDTVFVRNGVLARAPKHDSVKFTPGRRMLVPVDPITLRPLDSVERRLGHPAANAPGGEEANTCIVYLPPYFKTRVVIFVLTMWFSWSVFLCCISLLPIWLGRVLFERTLSLTNPPHDIYSYFVGGNLMILVGLILSKMVKMVRSLSNQASFNNFLTLLARSSYESSRWLLRVLFMTTVFGVCMPMMLGLVFELYVIIPFRDLYGQPPGIELFPMWSRGFAFMSLIHGFIRVLPANGWQTTLDELFQNGLDALQIKLLITKLVRPMVTLCVLAITVPLAIMVLSVKLLGHQQDIASQVNMLQTVYPASSAAVAFLLLYRVCAKFGRRWVQAVREDNFLEGRILHNFNEQPVSSSSS